MSDRPAQATAGLPDAIARAVTEVDELLAASDHALQFRYPGDRPGRQPVHTAYIPADQFRPDLAVEWGQQAMQALTDCAPSPTDFGEAMGVPDDIVAIVLERVLAK